MPAAIQSATSSSSSLSGPTVATAVSRSSPHRILRSNGVGGDEFADNGHTTAEKARGGEIGSRKMPVIWHFVEPMTGRKSFKLGRGVLFRRADVEKWMQGACE